jgi:hypothetical protein
MQIPCPIWTMIINDSAMVQDTTSKARTTIFSIQMIARELGTNRVLERIDLSCSTTTEFNLREVSMELESTQK